MGNLEDKVEVLIEEKYRNRSKFAQSIDIPRSTLYSALDNGILKSSVTTIIAIADGLELDLGEFVRGRIVPTSDVNRVTFVPLFGSVSAGTPLEMIDEQESFPIPTKFAEQFPGAFMLKVKGSSVDNILPDGHYALVKPCDTVTSNSTLYVVAIGNDAATVKHVQVLNNGIALLPDSKDPTFHPLVFDYSDPDAKEVSIIGRVVWSCPPPEAENEDDA